MRNRGTTMQNPFVYGKEVSGENFCNRKSEIAELTRDVENSQNVIIFSQRRFGKTSLIKKVFAVCEKKDIITMYVDLYPVLSEEDFVRVYAKTVAQALVGTVGNKMHEIANFFKRIRPQFTVEREGDLSCSIDISPRDVIPSLEDVIESVPRYIARRKKKAVVCFDEFQQINLFPTDRIEKILRSSFQQHKDISYIFMGSKKHLIFDMFNNPNRPFYRSAKSFPIHKIQDHELVNFILSKFERTGRALNKEMATEIMTICESHPYYVQYLCHIIWEETREQKNISTDDIHRALDLLLDRERATFESAWNLLPLNQKRFLVALAKQSKNNTLFSNEFLKTHQLSPTTVQRAVKSLIDKDLIDRDVDTYSIIDIFFKRWLERF